MMKGKVWNLVPLLSLPVVIALSGCTGSSTPAGSAASGGTSESKLTGKIDIDGSTTVYPIAEAMVGDFHPTEPGIDITVNKAGTGSGMQKFIRGEIDVCNASRPIEKEEIDAAKKAGIDFVEVPVAFDGITVIVNSANTWASDITTAELKKAWAPDSKVVNWSDIRPTWPKEKISFFGPTTNHGTFEYFTEAVVGKKNAQRTAGYQPNQEYNALVQGVANDKNALGYVGYSYYEQNKDKLKALTVDGVSPSPETIADGSYKPLSRPLFYYVSKKALDRPEVKAFFTYALGEGKSVINEVGYVPLPDDAYAAVKRNVDAVNVGSRFQGITPGMKLTDILAKEAVK